jgi:hypothetical protein
LNEVEELELLRFAQDKLREEPESSYSAEVHPR